MLYFLEAGIINCIQYLHINRYVLYTVITDIIELDIH